MKNKYISPTCETIQLIPDGLMQMWDSSVKQGSSEGADEGDVLSNKKSIWDNMNWDEE